MEALGNCPVCPPLNPALLSDTMNVTGNDPGPVTRTVCVSTYKELYDEDDYCCGQWSNTIEVKFCDSSDSNAFYVYKLKRVPYCYMAYCANNVTNSNISKPYI